MKPTLTSLLHFEWGCYWLFQLAISLTPSQHHDQVFLLLLEMWQKLRNADFVWWFAQMFLGELLDTIYTYHHELIKSLGSYGSLPLPFVMKVMVCHFMSTCHEIWLHSLSCYLKTAVVEISLQFHIDVFRWNWVCNCWQCHHSSNSFPFWRAQNRLEIINP
jgi:hypothetical protein